MPSDPYDFPDDFDPAGFVIDTDEMIIKRDKLLTLEDKIDELIHRAAYYERDIPITALFDLKALIKEIRQTGRQP